MQRGVPAAFSQRIAEPHVWQGLSEAGEAAAVAVVGEAGRGASGPASTSTSVRAAVLLLATILDEKSEPDFGFSMVVSM